MRIGLVGDIHANLPALTAARTLLEAEGCDVIVNLGDAITIGPHPEETVGYLRSHGIASVAGNHEDDLLLGFWPEHTARMGDGERLHYEWTFAQLSPESISWIRDLPHTLDLPVDGLLLRCAHFHLAEGRVRFDQAPVDRASLVANLGDDTDVIAFAHTHRALTNTNARPLLINPGACGLHHTGGPSVGIVDLNPGCAPAATILPLGYDPAPVLRDLRTLPVPDGDYVRETFFAGA